MMGKSSSTKPPRMPGRKGRLASRTSAGSETIRIAFSCGIAERCTQEALQALVARADTALYQAKRAGKNRCVRAR